MHWLGVNEFFDKNLFIFILEVRAALNSWKFTRQYALTLGSKDGMNKLKPTRFHVIYPRTGKSKRDKKKCANEIIMWNVLRDVLKIKKINSAIFKYFCGLE